MPLPNASEIVQQRLQIEGTTAEQKAQFPNGQIPTQSPWKQARPRKIFEIELERRARAAAEQAEREAKFEQQRPERERRLSAWRATHYVAELTELGQANENIAAFNAKIASLNAKLCDVKEETLRQPNDLDEIIEHSILLPSLREMIPLLESEIERCRGRIAEWSRNLERPATPKRKCQQTQKS